MTPEINFLVSTALCIKENGKCMGVEISDLNGVKELFVIQNKDIEKKLKDYKEMFDEHLISKDNRSVAITHLYEIDKIVTPNGTICF